MTARVRPSPLVVLAALVLFVLSLVVARATARSDNPGRDAGNRMEVSR